MFNMDWKITFVNQNGRYRLMLIDSVEIDSTVDNLTDTAVITLPEAVMNKVFDIQRTIDRGTQLRIELGYDGNLVTEFEGFVKEVNTDNKQLKITCEDALHLFRVPVPDREFTNTTVSEIAQWLIDNVSLTYKLKSDYNIGYEKFTVAQATAFDVLMKLQSETRGNIWFDTEQRVLHIHPAYIEKTGEVSYSMQHNVESSGLQWKRAEDRKVELTIESTDSSGRVTSITRGTTGGEEITLKRESLTPDSLEFIADSELRKRSFDGFEGSLDAWLIPNVKPGFTAFVQDKDYPHKDGAYYVVSVKTSFSASGGKRNVQLGIKLN